MIVSFCQLSFELSIIMALVENFIREHFNSGPICVPLCFLWLVWLRRGARPRNPSLTPETGWSLWEPKRVASWGYQVLPLMQSLALFKTSSIYLISPIIIKEKIDLINVISTTPSLRSGTLEGPFEQTQRSSRALNFVLSVAFGDTRTPVGVLYHIRGGNWHKPWLKVG